ncbi:hypothetical protein [Bacillus toyonensis]|uniref:hypothetical protein n=1 Tax=Bacillus toyonensis TaxID=155322 RepID=UPI002E23473F|nr:hypothetical protein [Bacillus toyonensis]
MEMERKDFFNAIRDSFFEELSVDLDSFKGMIQGAMPIFGSLESITEDNEDGGKTITFIDKHKADIIIGNKETDIDDVDTDMSTIVMQLTLNENGVIGTVSHSMGLFTRANKDQVLLLASFIGKKITF